MKEGDSAQPRGPLELLDIEDRLMEAHANQAREQREMLSCIVPLDDAEAWRTDGMCSMTDWLAYRLDLSHETAAEMVEVAHALEGLPRIASAYADGLFSWDQLRWLTRLATPDTDAELARDAVGWTPARLRSAARRARRLLRQEELAKARDERSKRTLRMWWERDMLRLSGRLCAAEGAVVQTALERIADQAFRAQSTDDGEPRDAKAIDPEPLTARYADALYELCSARLGADADPDRATVVVHADAAELVRDGYGELDNGVLLPAETLRRVACDARVQMRVRLPDGSPLGLGRTSRSPSPRLLREIRHRDMGRCRFPGCRRRFVRAHHIHHWGHGGRTEEDNLVLLCGYHHWLVHEGGWRLELTRERRLRFVRPNGTPLSRRPEPLRPERDPRRRRHRSRAP